LQKGSRSLSKTLFLFFRPEMLEAALKPRRGKHFDTIGLLQACPFQSPMSMKFEEVPALK
jgi:hypothetical protein